MFLFETIALVLSILAVALVHLWDDLSLRRCPRCRLPAGRRLGRRIVRAEAPQLFETWEAPRVVLSLIRPDGSNHPYEAGDRPVRRLLLRRETVSAHRCRLCRHAWERAEVEVVHGGAADVHAFPHVGA